MRFRFIFFSFSPALSYSFSVSFRSLVFLLMRKVVIFVRQHHVRVFIQNVPSACVFENKKRNGMCNFCKLVQLHLSCLVRGKDTQIEHLSVRHYNYRIFKIQKSIISNKNLKPANNMRSKRRSKNVTHFEMQNNNSIVKAMAVLLQKERQAHQATVAEFTTILNNERTEVNIFLKDMKKMLNDMEPLWPNEAFSSRNIPRRHVSTVKFDHDGFSIIQVRNRFYHFLIFSCCILDTQSKQLADGTVDIRLHFPWKWPLMQTFFQTISMVHGSYPITITEPKLNT